MNAKHFDKKPAILITTGEPAGIGMDIVIDVLANQSQLLSGLVIIAADKQALYDRATLLGYSLPTYPVIEFGADWQEQMVWHHTHSSACQIVILNVVCREPVKAGALSVQNAYMVEQQLSAAHTLASQQFVQAIITAPIQKSVMIDAGISLDNGDMFSGHTEYFMHKAGCDKVVMMLANRTMKVALVTTHLPLRQVADAITPDEVANTVKITHEALTKQFGIANPTILVCGLNPHAGEGGHLGDEEMTIIDPVLADFAKQGMDISLSMPADTLFTKHHLARADAIIAMYHDQGLAPLKSHGFGDTVNITLGLPYIRTSVDHGTALDLAGTGKASSSSLAQAIRQAYQMIAASMP
ncbi:4-hydroxythreonine-4-phosphate dehydrogenase PdxA [Moraxella nasicaprae]|uniref:4-hydroxythreonine-4-phosphate dehydrogenase PdxA n=1 Tax=Moraxella nasicaprae TaxID=2904122 RepID=A0ABY6F526_9GAMM|nr:4-hydroxythreonine-4-phosphate dehydrogenase PdxA [Moraxella nasicaprae]UXZ05000.1 4-hydroxythreonine-4-phosphate dehydrogenase PdxA [Moraxella nasicaprae]